MAAGMRPAFAQLCLSYGTHPARNGRRRCPDVEHDLRRQPEGPEARREGTRCGALAIEPERLHALKPLAHARQFDGRRRTGSRELDEEHARSDGRHGPPPRHGAVRKQANGSKQSGCTGIHPSHGSEDGQALSFGAS